MLQYGSGFRNFVIKRCHHQREIRSQYIVDETLLKVGSELIWLWVAIEPENGQILAQNMTQDRNMLITERFLSGVVKDYGNHPVSTDGGTWYPKACQFLKLDHHIHSPLEKAC